MTASVVEIETASGSNNPTLATTPGAGDVIVLITVTQNNALSAAPVSGCGATWTQLVADISGTTGSTTKSVEVWIGRGATSAGTITCGITGTGRSMRAYLVTGTNSTAAVATTTRGSAVSSLSGPSSTAGSGQLVIDAVYAYVTTTPTGAHTPSTGWTDQAVVTLATFYRYLSGWIAPGSTETVSTAWSSLSTSGQSVAVHIAVGDAPAVAITGELAAELPALTADLAGTYAAPPITGTLAATLPALEADVAGTYTGPTTGELAATLPPLTADLAGSYAPPAITGTLDAVLPPLTAALAGLAPKTLEITGTLPQLGGSLTLTQPYQTQRNNFYGRHRDGSGLMTWNPPVVEPPATGGGDAGVVVAPVAYDRAIAHGPVTITTVADDGRVAPTYTTAEASALQHRDRILVGNKDVTFFRGVATPTPDFTLVEPYLYGSGTLTFPQIFPAFEKLGEGDLAWVKPGATVYVQQVDTTTSPATVVATDYVGFISAFDVSGTNLVCDLGGQVTGRAALRNKRVEPFRASSDIGHQVYYFVTRQSAGFKPVLPEIGITTDVIGGMSDLDYGNQILAMAVDDSGRQWTCMPGTDRFYRLALKDTTTIDATVYFDDARMVPSLKRDISEEPNAVYATGVQSDGRRVRFAVYPGINQGPPPPYPFADNRTFGTGTTDADTDDPAGDLITAMLFRLQLMGYLEAEDTFDGYSTTVAAAVKELQRDAGISVTGSMTPATWRALYDLDATGYSLDGSVILPAAEDPKVRVWDRTSSGAFIRLNPLRDPTVIRVEHDIDVGTGFSRNQIRQYARGELTSDDNWVGTVECNLALVAGEHTPGDPITADDVMPARAVRPGMNVFAPGFDGGTLFHVSGVDVRGSDGGDATVTLTLDTKARDTMKAWEVIQRNRDSRANPARAWINQHRSSVIGKDGVTEWDPVGGVVTDRIKLRDSHWTVFPVVAGQEGTIARIKMATTPNAEFVVAVFGRQVTPEWLQHRVPAPLTKAGTKKWESEAVRNRLDEKLLLYIAGANDQPCGYWPGEKTDQDGGTSDRLTGVWSDDAGFGYRTFSHPVLWVAVWADRATKLDKGRIMWNQLEAGT